MSLYNLRTDGDGFRITKFDDDLNPEASYLVSFAGCECPAGHRDTCRHRKMLPVIKDRVDSNWFWDFDESRWVPGPGADEPTADVIIHPRPFKRRV